MTTTVARVEITPTELKPIEQGLSATKAAAQLAVLAAPLRKALVGGTEPVLPPGSALIFDPSSAVALGHGLAIRATVTGPLAGQWDVRLVKEGGQWRVLSAERSNAG